MVDEPGGRLKLLYVNDLAADRSCSDQRKVSFRIFECIRRSAVSDLHKVESSRLDSGLLPIRNAQHDDDAGSKHLPSPCDSTSPPPLFPAEWASGHGSLCPPCPWVRHGATGGMRALCFRYHRHLDSNGTSYHRDAFAVQIRSSDSPSSWATNNPQWPSTDSSARSQRSRSSGPRSQQPRFRSVGLLNVYPEQPVNKPCLHSSPLRSSSSSLHLPLPTKSHTRTMTRPSCPVCKPRLLD